MRHKKELAARIMKISKYKVRFAIDALDDIKKAITRSDLRGLIAIKKITKDTKNQHSRAGARKIAAQKRKGRQKGPGSKKGKKYSTVTRKERWMAKVRAQRKFLRELRTDGKITPKNFQNLYSKSKGGYFRNKRHIKLYITEHNLIGESKLTENIIKNGK
jgi:large subunit ribosomal protein L19e